METKDINRIQDIKNKPSDKHIGLATKMSKLITNGEKAKGRYEASCQIFGTHNEITQIFLRRAAELGGMLGTPVERTIEVGTMVSTDEGVKVEIKKVEKIIVQQEVNSIKRTKEDFPLSKKVKFEGVIGTVVSHEGETEDEIFILLEGQEKAIDVNIYKLKFA